jgi:hypothetical protein
MTATPESARARRYLLGEASDEECAVVEQDYLAHADAIDRIAAAEDDLIEDYLANQLSSGERALFERSYLSAPHHRIRVDTIRRLIAHGSPSAQVPTAVPALRETARIIPIRRLTPQTQKQLLALAASLILAASVAWVMFSLFGRRPADVVVDNRSPQPSTTVQPDRGTTTPAAAPRIFALTLSPVAVRSGSGNAAVAVPAGTTTLVIRLETDTGSRTLTAGRASIRTVGGHEVWQGPVGTERNPARGTIARLDVPAGRLPADDYLITLYGATRTGAEQEWAQYFLRIRAE